MTNPAAAGAVGSMGKVWRGEGWDLPEPVWPTARRTRPGYAVLLAVPPDLPVLTLLAFEACRRQRVDHLVETLILPDRCHASFEAYVRDLARTWPRGRLRPLPPRRTDRREQTRVPDRSHDERHIKRGLEATSATHALVHHVDVFLLDRGFFETRYARALEEGLDHLGVHDPASSPPPGDGGIDLGLEETLVRTRWARARPAADLRAEATAPHPAGRHPGFVRFPRVVATYRWFKTHRAATDAPFVDHRFHLLLIRALTDTFSFHGRGLAEDAGCVPALPTLEEGLRRGDGSVIYPRETAGAKAYIGFRVEMERLIDSYLLDRFARDRLASAFARFDAHYMG
jgi:hypothetical protein